jgi:hypothetical protein
MQRYVKGSSATVSATPNMGYTLTGWLLDGTPVAANNPYTLTMNSNHTITPIFTALPPVNYDLTVTINGQGSTNATGIHTYIKDTNVAVYATADNG